MYQNEAIFLRREFKGCVLRYYINNYTGNLTLLPFSLTKIMFDSCVVGQKRWKNAKISIQCKTPFYRDQDKRAHPDNRLPLQTLQGTNFRIIAPRITMIIKWKIIRNYINVARKSKKSKFIFEGPYFLNHYIYSFVNYIIRLQN